MNMYNVDKANFEPLVCFGSHIISLLLIHFDLDDLRVFRLFFFYHFMKTIYVNSTEMKNYAVIYHCVNF